MGIYDLANERKILCECVAECKKFSYQLHHLIFGKDSSNSRNSSKTVLNGLSFLPGPVIFVTNNTVSM